jgi:hypothetical protein
MNYHPAAYVVFLLMTVARLFGCALLLAACPVRPPPQTPDKDRLHEARDLIWELYSTPLPKPVIVLVEGRSLNCTRDGMPGFLSGGQCKRGELTTVVKVAYWGQAWSQTTLAHELMHYHLGRVTRNTDDAHLTVGAWELYGGGIPGPGRVGLANELLRAAGM